MRRASLAMYNTTEEVHCPGHRPAAITRHLSQRKQSWRRYWIKIELLRNFSRCANWEENISYYRIPASGLAPLEPEEHTAQNIIQAARASMDRDDEQGNVAQLRCAAIAMRRLKRADCRGVYPYDRMTAKGYPDFDVRPV